MKTFGTCRCRLISNRIDIRKVPAQLLEGDVEFDRDYCFAYFVTDFGYYVIFDFGVLVEWGEKLDDSVLEVFIDDDQPKLSPLEFEYLNYQIYDENRRIDDDVIYLSNQELNKVIILAYSYAMAQGHRLSHYESLISQTIDKSIYIPKTLANKGSINLSNKKIAKLRGELFLFNSDINLGFELLDTPNYFWEHPNEIRYYEEMANYLELGQRINIVNSKIKVISEILTMLADEQKHRDSSFLERVIIFLILVEVIIFLFHDILKLF